MSSVDKTILPNAPFYDDVTDHEGYIIYVKGDDLEVDFLVCNTKDGNGPGKIINRLNQVGLEVRWMIPISKFPEDSQ